MSKKEAVMVGVSHWPTELVAKAEYEFALFDKPSIDTCRELLDEVKMLRQKLIVVETMLRDIDKLDDADDLVTTNCESAIPTDNFNTVLFEINNYFYGK